MKDIPIKEFAEKHGACKSGVDWALENCKSGMMSEAYEKLSSDDGEKYPSFWDFAWLASHSITTHRIFAVRFIMETTFCDGRRTFELLKDSRSLEALYVAEKYSLGKSNDEELVKANESARLAYRDRINMVRPDVFSDEEHAITFIAKAVTKASAFIFPYNNEANRLDEFGQAVLMSWGVKEDLWHAASWMSSCCIAEESQKRIILDFGNPFRD